VAVALLICAFVLGNRSMRLHDPRALVATQNQAVLTFSDPADLSDLEQALNQSGVRYDQAELEWAARILGWRHFRSGRYVLDGVTDYDSFLSKMARGLQDPLKVTILPGIDWKHLTERLGSDLKAEQQDFLEASKDSAWLASKGLNRNELFGRMLPNTYEIYWDIAPRRFYDRILTFFEQQITKPYADRAAELNKDIDEIVTLASIIEWEAFDNEEKAKISGLYWNRLRRGMRLQADPTVIYAIGERRRLLYKDYQYDHPYNTYQIRGLPPGPITNPSKSSIKAALYPADHNYLYMVATPERTHDFSRTYSQHQQKSQEWRRWLRKQYRIKRQKEAQQSRDG
jgi:UPF0755 protein